jgi:hypothetical protein
MPSSSCPYARFERLAQVRRDLPVPLLRPVLVDQRCAGRGVTHTGHQLLEARVLGSDQGGGAARRRRPPAPARPTGVRRGRRSLRPCRSGGPHDENPTADFLQPIGSGALARDGRRPAGQLTSFARWAFGDWTAAPLPRPRGSVEDASGGRLRLGDGVGPHEAHGGQWLGSRAVGCGVRAVSPKNVRSSTALSPSRPHQSNNCVDHEDDSHNSDQHTDRDAD